MRGGKLPIFVDEAAEYEPRGDHIRVLWGDQEYVMPIAVAKKAIARFNRALDQWHESRCKIIPIPARHS